ncbi:unnamed protein product [Bemisia tabaci]|uniref:Striatin-interacting protein 1 homolog n=1 Tax=Bemisia tabaci TaxID=7038 RepID=A0A9P0AH73_BEMTA|nr:unnamed protein product [Bemisia tabaci]
MTKNLSCIGRRKPPEREYTDYSNEAADVDFTYADVDSHANEIAELYSYSEQSEFCLNVKAFESHFGAGLENQPFWHKFSLAEKKNSIGTLIDLLEVTDRNKRMTAARCLLYIAQGCWEECQSDVELMSKATENVVLLYECGAFHAFIDLLNLETGCKNTSVTSIKKLTNSIADSVDLRIILNFLNIIVEVMRTLQDSEKEEWRQVFEEFRSDISQPIRDELLAIKLFTLITQFCCGSASHFPVKKILLFLWKVILVSLGGSQELRRLKIQYREAAGLKPFLEDTVEIASTMRASSPPTSAADVIDAQNQIQKKRNNKPLRRNLMRLDSMDAPDFEDQNNGENDSSPNYMKEQVPDVFSLSGYRLDPNQSEQSDLDRSDDQLDQPDYDVCFKLKMTDDYDEDEVDNQSTPQLESSEQSGSDSMNTDVDMPMETGSCKGLPWAPKVRKKDLETFLDNTREKFLQFFLPGDTETLFGLPNPIFESVKVLKQHIYTSLAEVQIQREEELNRNPISMKESVINQTPTEVLYQAMLPQLPQFMIALLKILLVAGPTSKAKADSINIMADVLPEEMPMTVFQSIKLGMDVNRHKEIIVKAISAILLLLLKHFKINHVYQFEFMSQHIVFANCIPLILKFFNQNICAYVGAKHVIPILDFPACVIGCQPELTPESLEVGDNHNHCCWRNYFACINLLRILNKLTKWKHSRIMMLVVFKSAPILKRSLHVRNALMQLYVLKLLKMQTKYLGRQWRKINMKTMSAIYQKVRHRLNDDWAYGHDLDARPWDFQAEECALRASVDRFNTRRYNPAYLSNMSFPDFEPVDTNLLSVLSTPFELSEDFRQHYQVWLRQEVFQRNINWDVLLQPGYMG